ncbi:MAG: diguanylate cyclase domain-containing protein [Parahaliea sp.]
MAEPPCEDLRPGEEIEGAPPAETPAEIHARHRRETLTLNRYLYNQSQHLTRMLLAATDLETLLEVLLVSFPRYVDFRAVELWLHDPEDILSDLILDNVRACYGHSLHLHADIFTMYDLYQSEPDIEFVEATDSRLFRILQAEDQVDNALLIPLLDQGRLMGSLHCAMDEPDFFFEEAERDQLHRLATVISLCFKNAVVRQQLSRLMLIDPLTQISNLRGFEKDVAREIARARRAHKSLTLVMLDIDEYEDLYLNYGEVTGRLLVKKICERIASSLRSTDYLARLGRSQLAVLMPETNELRAADVAERLRQDIGHFTVDDGRGANLQVTLSLGYACWEPEHFPAVDFVALARQLQNAAAKGLADALAAGGNRVRMSRLTTLMV